MAAVVGINFIGVSLGWLKFWDFGKVRKISLFTWTFGIYYNIAKFGMKQSKEAQIWGFCFVVTYIWVFIFYFYHFVVFGVFEENRGGLVARLFLWIGMQGSLATTSYTIEGRWQLNIKQNGKILRTETLLSYLKDLEFF